MQEQQRASGQTNSKEPIYLQHTRPWKKHRNQEKWWNERSELVTRTTEAQRSVFETFLMRYWATWRLEQNTQGQRLWQNYATGILNSITCWHKFKPSWEVLTLISYSCTVGKHEIVVICFPVFLFVHRVTQIGAITSTFCLWSYTFKWLQPYFILITQLPRTGWERSEATLI